MDDSLIDGPVAFVTRKWSPTVGGMETYSVELAQELSRHVDFELIALAGRADGSRPSARTLLAFPFVAAWRYWRISRPPSVLHVGDLASWPLALLAWTRRRRPAIFISAHGTDASFPRRGGAAASLYGLYLRLGARLLRRARLIANSAATAAVAAESGWTNALVVPLATRAVAASPPSGHDGHLLFAGRLIESKGCLWFVRNVLPILPKDIRLEVAGPLWDEQERHALDDSRVNYLGALSKADLQVAYRRALCVIIPNIDPPSGGFEGFGLVAPEAAAAGGVVVAAATGGLKEAVIDSETGFLVPAGCPEAWAKKISQLSAWSAETRLAFIRRSMRRARDVYSWARVARDVLDAYEDSLRVKK